MSEPSRGVRRKRFKRSHVRVRLTPDDEAMLAHVHRHRFLRSSHLIKLMPHRPPKKLVERMSALYHAGYLDRPRAQIDYYSRTGSAPMVYALGDKSGEALLNFPSSDWAEKNRSVTRPYIEHALMIADIIVALDVALRPHPTLILEHADAMLALRPRATRSSPWKLSVMLTSRGRRFPATVIPDAVFAIRDRRTDRRRFFFLEADRGTMMIDSGDLSQPSYRRKLAVYYAALRARQHQALFGFDNVRVLNVTTSAVRAASMIAVVNDLLRGAPSGRFLFADLPSLSRADPLQLPWSTNARSVSLLS